MCVGAPGCTFDSLGGGVSPLSATGAGAAASFVECTFQNCGGGAPGDSAAMSGRGRRRSPPSRQDEKRHVLAASGGATVRLERCELRENPVSFSLAAMGAGSAFYADDAALKVQRTGGLAAPQPLEKAAKGSFLGAGDAWLLATQQVRCEWSTRHARMRRKRYGATLRQHACDHASLLEYGRSSCECARADVQRPRCCRRVVTFVCCSACWVACCHHAYVHVHARGPYRKFVH